MRSKQPTGISPEGFFKLVAVNAGVMDLQVVKDVIYGMIKTFSRELKSKQVVELPDWGKFRLKIHKSRRSLDVNRKNFINLPPKAVVKFTPDWKVKKYFYEFGESGK